MSSSVDLRQLAENLFALAPQERIGVVLKRQGYEIPEDDPESVLTLCLGQGVTYTIRELLEREGEIRELCEHMAIEVNDYDERDVMIEKINRLYVKEPERPIGVQSILSFVERGKESQDLPGLARECFLRIEALMKDFYGIYICSFLSPYLDLDGKESVENTIKKRPRIRNVIDQMIKYEKKIKNGRFPGFVEEMIQKNNQTSIFQGVEDLDGLLELVNIRNEYLFHNNNHAEKDVRLQSKRFFDIVEMLFSQLTSPPMAIVPQRHGTNEMGYHYIEFLDENGETRKFYLYERPPNFKPDKQAYCFHPIRKHPMIDPTIIYRHELIFSQRTTEVVHS